MNLDLLVCGLVLLFALIGAAAGGLLQISHLGAVLLGGLAGRWAGLTFGREAAHRFNVPDFVGVVGVTVAAFIFTYAIFHIVLRMLLKRVLQNPYLGSADRLVGFLFGGVRSALVLWVLLSALLFFERPIAKIEPRLHFDTRGSHVASLVREHNLFTRLSFPNTRGLTALAQAATDPRAAERLSQDPEIQALARDPRIQEIARDPEVQRSLQSGDQLGLLRSNRVVSLLSDPQLQERLTRISEHLGSDAPEGEHPHTRADGAGTRRSEAGAHRP